jgi:hypothetical protein
MFLVLLYPIIWLSFLGLGVYFAARLVRAFERRGADQADSRTSVSALPS